MAEDQEGEIWVGTDKGIGVFIAPRQFLILRAVTPLKY